MYLNNWGLKYYYIKSKSQEESIKDMRALQECVILSREKFELTNKTRLIA